MSFRWRRSIALLSATLGLMCAAASPKPGVDTARLMSDPPALTLQAYGLFEDASGRRPAPGVTPYTLNTPLFSDYAEKRRYLYLPSRPSDIDRINVMLRITRDPSRLGS